ncbi:MAG: NERD domain-containing protein [Sulfuricaulis sp.]|uniref:NERD domain-containing protein n=1 Tax=Sulfuricaulis sp. TaxID=2003553 RepID=UPI0034A13B1B
MTIVDGQIESLKKLKEILNQNGITRFNSIGEIDNFIKNYDFEKKVISKQIEHTLDLEINDLQSDLIKHQQVYDNLKAEITNKVNTKIKNLKDKINLIEERSKNNLIKKIFFFPQLAILKLKKSSLEKNFEKIIHKKTYVAEHQVINIKQKLDDFSENKEKIILERSLPSHEELAFTKEVVEGLYTLIAGAIGESLVVKELQKLSDNYVLFNDFSIELNPPIFNRKENDRIRSIQIDHLLIANSGIFILETKNWSKESIKNLDLRSPIKQIMRTSYALFVLLNSESEYKEINLNSHHWGNKQIPIRNIIVMINEKPKEKFKYVKVKSVSELNGYITYFEPIFNDAEVKSISDYLRMNMH